MKNRPVGLLDLSLSAPELPDNLVNRPNLVETLDHTVRSTTDVVCLEAPEGTGKTTLVLELASVTTNPCFSIFVSTPSRVAYDPSFMRQDLINQIHWFLHGERYPDLKETTSGELHNYWAKCVRKLQRNRTLAIVIADGLDELPEEDSHIVDAIIDLLPLGLRAFRFIFTGQKQRVLGKRAAKIPTKSFLVPAFALYESNEFLKDVVNDPTTRSELHHTFRGLPAALASVRRQILSKGRADDVMRNLPEDLAELLNREWSQVEKQPEDVQKAIVLLAAHGYPVEISTLSSECDTDTSKLEKAFEDLPILTLSKRDGGWMFISDTFRRMVEDRLPALVEKAYETIVDRLFRDPDGESSTFNRLPAYLERSGKAGALIEWLHERQLATILFRSQTTSALNATLKIAINVSYEARRDQPLMGYALARSIMFESADTSGQHYEVRARVALADYDGASAIANNAPLITQRLRLLAVLADSASASSGIDSGPVRDQIRELYRSLDLATIPSEELAGLATDLFPVDGEMALELLKHATKSDTSEYAFEVALVRATVTSMLQSQDSGSNEPKRSLASEKVEDENLRELLDKLDSTLRPQSADDIDENTKNMEVSERLYFLRKWAARNPRREDAIGIVDVAIHEAIGSGSFVPNASFYREITIPLPFTKDDKLRKTLVSIIDGQQQVIRSKGPTQDIVRLELRLAECDYRDDVAKAVDRLEDLYLEIVEPMEELDKRVNCLAWFLSLLSRLDSSRFSELRELIEENFWNTAEELLSDSADHHAILKDSLRALGIAKPSLALKLVDRFNTVDRRQQGRCDVASSMCEARTTQPDVAMLCEILSLIQGIRGFDEIVLKASKRVFGDVKDGLGTFESVRPLLPFIEESWSIVNKTRCYGELALGLWKTASDDDKEWIRQHFTAAFDQIVIPRDKYVAACRLIAQLREECPELTTDLYSYLKSDERKALRESEQMDGMLCAVLELATKGHSALCDAGVESENDLGRVTDLIRRLHDPCLRVRLYSGLAVYLWKAGCQKDFSSVVEECIWRELEGKIKIDKYRHYQNLIISYAAIWLENRDRARDYLSGLPKQIRSDCIWILCKVLTEKQPVGEPFSGDDVGAVNLTYGEILDLIKLCREVSNDYSIYFILRNIADTIESEKTKDRLSREQRTQISREMIAVADATLPMPDHIQHDGYKIICKAQALRVNPIKEVSWDDLVRDAKAIPNGADKLFVNTILAGFLPKKRSKEAIRILKDSRRQCQDMPAAEDRFGRLQYISEVAYKKDRILGRDALEEAFNLLIRDKARDNERKERALIDLAYRIDPELPMKLASLYDDDPARERYKALVTGEVSMKDCSRALADPRKEVATAALPSRDSIRQVAREALGKLNSGMTVPARIDRIRSMVAMAGDFPLDTSQSLYAWSLASANYRYANTSEASTFLRDLFEGTLLASEFAFAVATGNARERRSPEWQDLKGEDQRQKLFKSGEREKAMTFIRRWIRTQATNYVKVCDPYFGTTDLDFVRLVLEESPDLRVTILTSKQHQIQTGLLQDLPHAYSSYWRQSVCDMTPPDTEIIVVGIGKSGKPPIHDRWILSEGTGLRLGSSLNSLGRKDTEIVRLGSEEALKLEGRMDQYLDRKVREIEGDRVSYELFNLDG